MPDFPGEARDDACGFSLIGKIYYGCGIDFYYNYRKDWWSYDTVNNQWTQISDLPGSPRQYATVVTSNERAFLIGGQTDTGFTNEVFVFQAGTARWKVAGRAPFRPRAAAFSFCIGEKIYYGSGRSNNERFNDFYSYNIVEDRWKKLDDLPFGARDEVTAFAAMGYGYAMLGRDGEESYRDVWEFDPQLEVWMKREDYPGNARSYAEAVQEPGGAFIIGGQDEYGALLSDVYYYDAEVDAWIKMMDLEYGPLRGVTPVRLGNTIYVIGGITEGFTRVRKMQKLQLNAAEIDPVIRIGPNPTYDRLKLYFEADHLYHETELVFYDDKGQIRYQSAIRPGQYLMDISVQDWGTGIYWLRYYIDGKERLFPILVSP